jgi:hypothetical protein
MCLMPCTQHDQTAVVLIPETFSLRRILPEYRTIVPNPALQNPAQMNVFGCTYTSRKQLRASQPAFSKRHRISTFVLSPFASLQFFPSAPPHDYPNKNRPCSPSPR